MADQVTVTIPQRVYDRAQQLALLHNKEVADVLAEALELAEEAGREAQSEEQLMAREEAAYQAMREELVARYVGEYVAIHRGQLVDHDSDELALLKRIDAKYPDEVVLMRRVLPQPESELRFRSPRLIRER